MDRGAHFHRSDLQVHTPRDLNWQGDRAVSDEERRAFAEELVAACRSKGLQAIAITDHHDTVLFRYVKEAASAETDETGGPLPEESKLVVFPGMELTLGLPCQALLLFDADFPVDLLEQASQALSITPAPAVEEKHAPIKRLEHITEFDQLFEQLSQREFIRGRFFVMPHVGENGEFSLLRKGFAPKYKQMECVGGFVDGSLAQHGTGNKGIVAGKNKEWGNKAIGLFQTSDNRRRDFADLGRHTTWIKWARPTAEALRQACLARESRLSQEPPQTPSVQITAVEVSNSQFLGPISLSLNPQYNALIGGRGTGKSTILEYLRWGLCDQPPAGDEAELPDFQRRRRELVKNTLEPYGATVTISFVKNGIGHVLRRKAGIPGMLVKIAESEFVQCSEEDVRNLLPVHAYSQRQLSSVGVKLDELDRFLHAPVKEQLDALETERAELRTALRAGYEEVKRLHAVSSELRKLELERTSVSEQVTNLRRGLAGLSDEDRAVIARESAYERSERLVAQWQNDLERAARALEGAAAEIAEMPASVPAGDLAQPESLNEMHDALGAWFEDARRTLKEIRTSLGDTSEEAALAPYRKARSRWEEERNANAVAYGAAKDRSASHEGTLRQIVAAESRLKELEGVLAERRRTVQKLASAVERFADQRRAWGDLHDRTSAVVGEQCDRLTGLSKGLIRAQLRKGYRAEAIDEKLRSALKGSKIRSERFDRLWQRIREAQSPYSEWTVILDELECLVRAETSTESSGSLPPTPVLDSLEFTIRERQAIARGLSPEAWLDLLLMELEDLPEFEYRVREGEYIKFSLASAGQQATALMYVLLNQEGPPLIVDQPEDDLDNKVMGEIVREIWGSKSRRQLIFSSHNANLVVNGDAELVVCCDYRIAGDQSGGRIKLEGAIDVPEINAEITAVMEGGREAFALRRAKYGF